jgi:hypothetical protein
MASLCLNKPTLAFLVEEQSALPSPKDSEMAWLINH